MLPCSFCICQSFQDAPLFPIFGAAILPWIWATVTLRIFAHSRNSRLGCIAAFTLPPPFGLVTLGYTGTRARGPLAADTSHCPWQPLADRWLQCLSLMLVPLCRSVCGLFGLALLSVLGSALPFRCVRSAIHFAFPHHVAADTIAPLCGIGSPNAAQPGNANEFPRVRRHPQLRPHSRVMQLLLWYVGFASLPFCVWGRPPDEWSFAVYEAHRVAQLQPDSLHPTTDPPNRVGLHAPEEAALPSDSDPLHEAWEPRTDHVARQGFITGFFEVLCPMHHSEYVQLILRVPGISPAEALEEIRLSLFSLRLTYARTVIPTVPQLYDGFASVVLCGSWHDAFGDVVVLMDFRAFGGRVYAKHVCLDGRFADLADEAAHQQIDGWQAYLFGSHHPLPDGGRFRPIPGGVIKFLPRGTEPCWQGSFEARFGTQAAWSASPWIAVQPCLNRLILTEDSGHIHHGPASDELPSLPPRAVSEGYAAHEPTIVRPHHSALEDVTWRGTVCNATFAVSYRLGISFGVFVFLDARQVGQPPTWVCLSTNEACLGYLARTAGIHRLPAGYHLSVVYARPSLRENHVLLNNGDTVTFGFRNEAESDADGDSSYRSSRRESSDEESGSTRPPSPSSGSHPPDDHAGPAEPQGRNDDRSRSRSPRQLSCPFGVFCSLLLSPALRKYFGVLCVLVEAVSLRRLGAAGCSKWIRSFFAAHVIADDSPVSTSVLPSQTNPVAESPQLNALLPCVSFKSVPQPTLVQRVRHPGTALRDDDGNALPGNEGEVETRDLFEDEAGPGVDTDSSWGGSDEGSDGLLHLVCLILVVDCLPEQVEIALEPGASVDDLLNVIADHMDEARYIRYPLLRAVHPQPDRYWATVIALPSWADRENIACCDLREVDGRLFALDVPISATKDQLCRLVGIDPQAVCVFPYGAPAPMDDAAVAEYVPGGCITFCERPFLPRPRQPLAQLLAYPHAWDPNPDIPYGPVGLRHCCVFDNGHRLVTAERVGTIELADAVARTNRIDIDLFELVRADPRVGDAAIKGHNCQDVFAVYLRHASRGPRHPQFLVDCRPLLQGWSLHEAPNGFARHSALITELETFAPAGWQLQLDPISVTDDFFPVHDGLVVCATYVPLTTDEEADDPPGDSSSVHATESAESDGDEVAREDNTGQHSQAGTQSRSRSRSPNPHPCPSAGTGTCRASSVGNGCARKFILLAGCALLLHTCNCSIAVPLRHVISLIAGSNNFQLPVALCLGLTLCQSRIRFPTFLLLLLLAFWVCEPAAAMQISGPRMPPVTVPSFAGDPWSFGATVVTGVAAKVIAASDTEPSRGHIRAVPTPCRNSRRGEICLDIPSPDAVPMTVLAHAAVASSASASDQACGANRLQKCNRPTLELDSLLPVDSSLPLPATPACEVFDLEARQCLLPGDEGVIDELLRVCAFSTLQGVPQGLDKPGRFLEWVSSGIVGCSPRPGDILVLTSDGSFQAATATMGWGVTLSLVDSTTMMLPGVFIGCLYGDVTVPDPQEHALADSVDAYTAEVKGLLWSAVALLQLPVGVPVVVRSDNLAALRGAEGTMQMRPTMLCQAMRCLHAAVAVRLGRMPTYQHVVGHSGDAANELSDSFANAGTRGHSRCAPFSFRSSALLRPRHSPLQWLPHICMSRKRASDLPALRGQLMSWSRVPGVCHQNASFAMAPFLRALPPVQDEVGPAQPTGGHLVELKMASFNALSLLDGDSQPSKAAGLHGQVGRPTLLQKSLEWAGIQVAGVQECRTPTGRMRCGPYCRFSSGCDTRSCFGVELWVLDGGPCEASSVTVLHTDPTRLIASARLASLTIQILVAHGPHRGHDSATKKEWWERTAQLCRTFVHSDVWVFLMDANSRVGSHNSPSIGPHQADPEDTSGALMHRLLVNVDVWLPATYEECMQGEGGTLIQKRNGELARSDYIGLPRSWLQCPCSVYVDPTVSAGHLSPDHYATVASVNLLIPGPKPTHRRSVRIDAEALGDPEHAWLVHQVLDNVPQVPWCTDASEHVAQVVDHIYTGLAASFPAGKRGLRRSYLTEATALLHRTAAILRRAVRNRSSALRLTVLRCAWLAWRNPAAAFGDLYSGQWLWDLKTKYGLSCMLLRRASQRLRASCRCDRDAALAQLSLDVEHASPAEVHKAVLKIIKPKKYRRTQNDPLPALKKPDGSLCQSETEVRDTWRNHFSSLEGGVVVSAEDLVLKCRARQAALEEEDELPAEAIPSWTTLEAAFRHTSARKAAGPDLVPPALCRFFGHRLTEIFWPVLLKQVCLSAEAAGLKGGLMHAISKPNAPDARSCASKRGILVQSCIAKALHRAFRGQFVSHWCSHSLPLQVGGKVGCSANFGHLVSRAVLHFARVQHMSAGLLFLDLASAYYAVIRETVVGGGLSEQPIDEIAKALELSPDDLQYLAHLVDSEPILHTQEAHPALTALAREVHAQTWFVMSNDNSLVATSRGTRPGGALADIIFNILFAKAVQRRHSSALANAVPVVPWSGNKSIFPGPPGRDAVDVRITDVIYADDMCTPIVCPEAKMLRPTVSATVADTVNTLSPHALRVNVGPTKTAALMAPRGAGSKQVRHEIFTTLKGRIPVFPDHKGMLWLDLVPRYRHLGSIVSYSGSLLPEVRHRLSLGQAAFRAARRKLFACKSIAMARRAALLRSHVLSVVLVGSGSWPSLSRQEWTCFSGGIISIYRQMLGLRAEQSWNLTEAQLISRVGLPSPAALLHAERLRFAAQLVRSAPEAIWALLGWYDPFQQAVREAGCWLLQAIGHQSELGPIDADWDSWSQIMQSQAGRFKGWIRRAEACDVLRHHIRAEFDAIIRSVWSPLSEASASPLTGLLHACLQCGLAFPSRQQWGAHAQRLHGYRNLATRVAAGRLCSACGACFANPSRLQKHLLFSARCAQHIESDETAAAAADATTASHVQAPARRGWGKDALPPPQPEFCKALLAELSARMPDTDQAIYNVVVAHLAPLPVLRHTVELWIGTLGDPRLVEAARDVLLVLWPEHLCSRVVGVDRGASDSAKSFAPLIVRPAFRSSDACLPVYWSGGLDCAWVHDWGLEDVPACALDCVGLPDTLRCRGLCMVFQCPFSPGPDLFDPPSLPLRVLRLRCEWTLSFLRALSCALRTSLCGTPVHCVFPFPASVLGRLSDWISHMAVPALSDGDSAHCCLTLEFA